MHRCHALVLCIAAISATSVTTPIAAASGATAAAGSEKTVKCADVLTTTLAGTPAAGAPSGGSTPCWVEEKYPFISEAEEGEGRTGKQPSSEPCSLVRANKETKETCDLQVFSMVFNGWNRGRAVTEGASASTKLVWEYNGVRWSPESAFLAQRKNCTGTTIIAAGNEDYWLINARPELPGQPWSKLCRFDGRTGEWGPVAIPKTTAERLTYPRNEDGKLIEKTRNGGITSGACFAYNDCWFFGSYGVTLHWSEAIEPGGKEPVLALREAGTPTNPNLLSGGEFLAAAASGGFGLAVGAVSEGATEPDGEESKGAPLQSEAGGLPPEQLYSSTGLAFSGVEFTPPTVAAEDDPYRTNLIAVGVDPAGEGWVAGDPAVASRTGPALPAPLLPVSRFGETTSCVTPPAFMDAPEDTAAEAPGSFDWKAIAVIPATGEAIAGGRMRRTPEEAAAGAASEDSNGEPVIAQVSCQGTTTLTRFRTKEIAADGSETDNPAPADPAESAASEEGAVRALAACAANDAWVATGLGRFLSGAPAVPHLYHLTNGGPPECETASDRESQAERPIEVITPTEEKPPPVAAPPPTTVTTKRTIKLPAAIYDVKAKVRSSDAGGHVTLSLAISFRLRRAVTVGAHALRGGRLVSVARPKRFTGHSGELVLILNRARWPTKITFVT